MCKVVALLVVVSLFCVVICGCSSGSGHGIASGKASIQNFRWLKFHYGTKLQDVVDPGPSGSYSWDFGPAHFIALNQYYDNPRCDFNPNRATVNDELRAWLENDLIENSKEIIFVFGHTPAFFEKDEHSSEWGYREAPMLYEEVYERDLFWDVLSNYNVNIFFCGHMQTYSKVEEDGVYQVVAGESRGSGTIDTFLNVCVETNSIFIDVWRDIATDNVFEIADTIEVPLGFSLSPDETFTFTVTSDNHGTDEFSEVLEQIESNVGDIGVCHISTGDTVDGRKTYNQIKDRFGENVKFFPVVGECDY